MEDETARSISRVLARYLPSKLEEDVVNYYLGKSQYTRDLNALDKTFNKPIRTFLLEGGKRLRPTLFFSFLEGFGISNYLEYEDIAFAIELAHNATLVIDDVEDSSKLRRGKPTMHETHGVDIAVNAGVTMHILPLRILLQATHKLSDHQRIEVMEIFNEEIIRVYFGQAIDIAWHQNSAKSVTENEYLAMCQLKTGSLMRMSVRLAHLLANKDKADADDFCHFAESVGIGFQVKDDILDLTSTEEKFGKTRGNDISEGKMSLPVIYALTELSTREANRLKEILALHTHDSAVITEALALIKKTGAIERAQAAAENRVLDAWQKIEPKIPNAAGRQKVHSLIETFVTRDH